MSITFEIVKFKKPTKDDLSNLHMFNPYGSIPILDDDDDSTGWNIYMFRADDKDIQNIINSSYAVKMELPEYITDYDSFLKIKALWNSSENNLYGIDKKKAIKCIPDIEDYEYVPVNNSMLAKAEIPFLIFERNRGKCFIEMY